MLKLQLFYFILVGFFQNFDLFFMQAIQIYNRTLITHDEGNKHDVLNFEFTHFDVTSLNTRLTHCKRQ